MQVKCLTSISLSPILNSVSPHAMLKESYDHEVFGAVLVATSTLRRDVRVSDTFILPHCNYINVQLCITNYSQMSRHKTTQAVRIRILNKT